MMSNSESILQQQFGENPGNDCCYSVYMLTSAQLFDSQDSDYNKSPMTILALAGVWIIVCSEENTYLGA